MMIRTMMLMMIKHFVSLNKILTKPCTWHVAPWWSCPYLQLNNDRCRKPVTHIIVIVVFVSTIIVKIIVVFVVIIIIDLVFVLWRKESCYDINCPTVFFTFYGEWFVNPFACEQLKSEYHLAQNHRFPCVSMNMALTALNMALNPCFLRKYIDLFFTAVISFLITASETTLYPTLFLSSPTHLFRSFFDRFKDILAQGLIYF